MILMEPCETTSSINRDDWWPHWYVSLVCTIIIRSAIDHPNLNLVCLVFQTTSWLFGSNQIKYIVLRQKYIHLAVSTKMDGWMVVAEPGWVGDPLFLPFERIPYNAIWTVATPSAVTATPTMVDTATGMESTQTVAPATLTTMNGAMPWPLCPLSMDGIWTRWVCFPFPSEKIWSIPAKRSLWNEPKGWPLSSFHLKFKLERSRAVVKSLKSRCWFWFRCSSLSFEWKTKSLYFTRSVSGREDICEWGVWVRKHDSRRLFESRQGPERLCLSLRVWFGSCRVWF